MQKDSYFSEFFWKRYGLPKFDLESAISKNRENKRNILEMFKSLTEGAHRSSAHLAEPVRTSEK